MISLDIDDTRRDMVADLLKHLPEEPDDESLAMLAAACRGLDDPLEAIIRETRIE